MGAADGRRRLGGRGEQHAVTYLRQRGMSVLEVNARCRMGEIDIVAMDSGTVVFVEVKSKRGPGFGRPEEMITSAKRRRLTVLARAYLHRRRWQGRPARFDVVAVDWKPGGSELRYYRGAFPAEGGW